MNEILERIIPLFQTFQSSAERFWENELTLPFFDFEEIGISQSAPQWGADLSVPEPSVLQLPPTSWLWEFEAVVPTTFPEIPFLGKENSLYDAQGGDTIFSSSSPLSLSTVSENIRDEILYESGNFREYHVHKEAPQIAIEFSGTIHKDVDMNALLQRMKSKLQEELSAETALQYYY